MNLQTFLKNISIFLDDTLMPFLMVLGGFFFVWNAARYFILGGANPDAQEKARTHALWGILAFVVIFSVWGAVRLLVDSFGFGPNQPVTPDYIETYSPGRII